MRARVFAMVLFLSLVWAMCPLSSAQAQGQSHFTELDKFQGTWVLVSAEMDGKQVEEAYVKQSKITFVGNKAELIVPHQHKDTIFATFVKMDETKKPMEMQWVRSTGPNAGTVVTAIYEFEGPDKYRICFDPTGSTVPKIFDTDEGSGHIWQTWQRVKQ